MSMKQLDLGMEMHKSLAMNVLIFYKKKKERRIVETLFFLLLSFSRTMAQYSPN